MASRRLVFPAPFGPQMTAVSASSSVRASERLRNPRHSTAPTTIVIPRLLSARRSSSRYGWSGDQPSDVQANRHHQVAEVLLAGGLEQPRSERRDQLEDDLVRIDALEAVPDELGVEADLQQLTAVRRGERLAGVAEVGRLRGDDQLPLAEGEPKGSVALGELRDPPGHLEELGPGQLHLVLVGLGKQLRMVRELTIDQPGAERDGADAEDRLVARQPHLQRVLPTGLDQPGELPQRSRWDVRLEALRYGGRELRGLHGESIGVGGHHRHLIALDGDEDARENRASFVAGGGARDTVDRVAERGRGQRDPLSLRLGEAREVVRRQGAKMEARGSRADLDVALGLAKGESDGAIGKGAGDLDEEPAGEDDRSASLDLTLEANLEPELHIGRAERRTTVRGDQDSRERLKGSAGRDGARDHEQGIEK